MLRAPMKLGPVTKHRSLLIFLPIVSALVELLWGLKGATYEYIAFYGRDLTGGRQQARKQLTVVCLACVVIG